MSPPNVVIDLGNTLTKVALFNAAEMLSINIFERGSVNKFEAYLKSLERNSYCIISSVINHPESFSIFLQKHFRTLILDAKTPIPITNIYKTPDTLGKDRIAAAVASWQRFPEKNLLVIDAGTAITIDLVTEHSEFVGGAISPGIDLRLKALHTFTGMLPLVERRDIDYLTGSTTEESILSGVINGIATEIDGIIDKYKTKYPGLIIIFGGGDSNFLHKRLKNSIFALPNPVLIGLNTILNYNIENNTLS